MNLEFESDRLKLRPLSENDLDLAFALWLDPDVTKYIGGVRTKKMLIEKHPIAMRRCCGGCIGIWALTTKQDNEKIGTTILLPMPIEEVTRIGTWFLVTKYRIVILKSGTY